MGSRRSGVAVVVVTVLALALAGVVVARDRGLLDTHAAMCRAGSDAGGDADGGAVVAVDHLVVAANPVAAEIGCAVLVRGGTAADAAVAVAFALAVVEPQSSGLGGGTVVIWFDASTGDVRSFDGLSQAPATTTEGLRTPTAAEQRAGIEKFDPDVRHTGRAVGVPGTVAVLGLLHDELGRLPWDDLVRPAVDLAREGAPIAPYLHDVLASTASGVDRCDLPDLARWCADGEPLPVGTTVANPELAEVLGELRDGGARAFYDPAGTIAPAIVERVAAGPLDLDPASGPAVVPSLMTVQDLAGYRAVEREPVCDEVLEHTVCTAPPPSSGGITLLQTLAVLERVGVAETIPGTLDRVHLAIEASRLAQADRREYVGDPRTRPVPIAGLLDDGYLDQRAALVAPDRALGEVEPGRPDGVDDDAGATDTATGGGDQADATSHVSIVDAAGNAISMTSSINDEFGSQLQARGIALDNVQHNFTRLDSISRGERANPMTPGARPRTTMTPTVVLDDDRLVLVVGSAGGSAIPDAVSQVVLAVLVDGVTPDEAVAEPHWSGQAITSRCPDEIGPRSEVEEDTALADLVDELEDLGHPCARAARLRSGAAVVQVRPEGVLVGAADPRRDGAAVGH